MRRVRAVASTIVYALIGYAAAVVASVLMVIIAMTLPTIFPDEGRWGSFYAHIRDAGTMLVGGLTITAMTAWPGFLVTLFLNLTDRVRMTKFGFAIAGGLTSIQAMLLYSSPHIGSMIEMFLQLDVLIPVLIGGLFGGYVYGWVHSLLFSSSEASQSRGHVQT